MKKPALQNIPLRTEIGRRIREVFEAQETKSAVDYSAVEQRILAAQKKEFKDQITVVCDLAEEMSYCDSYQLRDDETGEKLGRDQKIVKAIKRVREIFGVR